MKDFTVVLIRHGQSSANVSHMLSGCMDVPLTENGIRELESLRKKVDYPQDGIFFSSPLQRCIDTFHILFPGRTPVIRDSFHEIDFRSLEGWILSTPEEISAYFESWVHDEGYLDEETFSEVSERGSQAILDMVEECSAKGLSTATVVMHSGIMRASLVRLFSMEREEFLRMTVPNGLGVVIRFSDGKPASWSWLERRG